MLVLNSKYNKSTNILYDEEDCSDYIINQSAKDVLSVLFKINYHNSIALIGPFGCGKSSLLLYVNTILSQDKNAEKCLKILKVTDKSLFNQFAIFIKDKIFFRIKIVGEYNSFKSQFKNTILQYKHLKNTNRYLKKDKTFQISKALELLDKDLKINKYSDILFSIDEFGKFIEYGLDNKNSNDIFDLQTLSEYINKKNNYKLIISLHKAFGEYINNDIDISYSDWDKIQGRFENIVFRDNYFEMLNIFKETIVLKNTKEIKEAQKIIGYICKNSNLKDNDKNLELFRSIVPIHPFSAIVISEIFTKYFQNQRSIFSFLFSTEPNAFQEFIQEAQKKSLLYSLSDLYKYIKYLLKVYSILLPDKEIWYMAEHRLKDYRVQNELKTSLIKIIAIIHAFKLSNTIKTDKKHLALSLSDRFSKENVDNAIDELELENILVFQEQAQSYSLLEDSNINIHKELNTRLAKNCKINFEKQLNLLMQDKFLIAKRYFVEYGNKKCFEKLYILEATKLFQKKHKLFLSPKNKNELLNYSKNNNKSIFMCIENISQIELLIKKIEALNDIGNEFSSIISANTKDILNNMLDDSILALENLLNNKYISDSIFYNGKQYPYSSKKLQEIISDIITNSYHSAPKINNYNLNHTIATKATNTIAVKKLFEAMLINSDKEDLGIEKFPAQMALYLSVIKPAGIHRIVDGRWELVKPSNLNFEPIWNLIKELLSQKINLEKLIEKLSLEPYGLDRSIAMFIISLFIIVNQEKINLTRDNTYVFDLSVELLMNMWKIPNRYEIQLIQLNKEEKDLFKAYVQIATDLTEYSYSKDKVSSIIKNLHEKFSLLPNYAKNTQKLSNESKNLRSAIISMKEPIEAFFILFPKALGYDNLQDISNDDFINKFKYTFNEIALSYKKQILELESFLAKVLHLENQNFPYGKSLINLSNNLSNISSLDSKTKALARSFTYANSIVELFDSIAVLLIGKKIEECYDNDINVLKDTLKNISNDILSKLELSDIKNDKKDVRKISLSMLSSNLNRVISVDKSKLDTINNKVAELNKMIPEEYSEDEKLFLISQLLKKELNHE